MSDGETPSGDLTTGDGDGSGDRPHPWEVATRSDKNQLLRHAGDGALVTVGLVFLVVSPLLGGLLAGWTHREDGARVGGLSEPSRWCPSAS